MKNFFIITGVVIVGMIALTLFFNRNTTMKASTEQEVAQLFNNNETFLLVIGSTQCPACVEYVRDVATYYKNNDNRVPIHVLYSDRSFSGITAFSNFLVDYGMTDYNASPTTYFIRDGNVVDRVEGPITGNALNEFINRN